MVTPKRIVLSLLLVAWLGLGAYSGRYIAGGAVLLFHKINPANAQADTWKTHWEAYQDNDKERKRLKVAAALPVVLFLGVPLFMALASLNRGRSLHGDARWATNAEARAAGLTCDHGVVLGKLGGKFMMHDLAKFLLLIAPTRSGKGVGIIIPNLLNWNHSAIVSDIKGENFAITSGFRASHGQAVYKFAPFDPLFETHRWNPLSYVSRDPRFIVGDLQSIGYMIYPRKDGSDAFWNDQARNLFVAMTLYCAEAGFPVTIGEALRLAPGGGKPKEYWQGIVDGGRAVNGVALSDDCIAALRQFVGNSDNTLTSILASFTAPLGVFANPLVDAATSADDFDVRDIFKQKMSIYLVIPPNRLAEAGLLMNLFFSVAYDQNTKALPEQDPSRKYLCLMVQDEFPAFGRIDKFVRAVGYLAGYGFRCITVAQSVSQLQSRELYGEEGARTILSNHMLQVMYAPREQKDAAEYSEILGYLTQEGVSRGHSRNTGTGKFGSTTRSENVSDHKRALMLPQELRELGERQEIVISDNCKPILAEKVRYYDEPVFKQRLMPPVRVSPIDLDAFLRQRHALRAAMNGGGNGVIEPLPGQAAARASRSNSDDFPVVSPGTSPIASEVNAVAQWLFKHVDWSRGEDAAATVDEPTLEPVA